MREDRQYTLRKVRALRNLDPQFGESVSTSSFPHLLREEWDALAVYGSFLVEKRLEDGSERGHGPPKRRRGERVLPLGDGSLVLRRVERERKGNEGRLRVGGVVHGDRTALSVHCGSAEGVERVGCDAKRFEEVLVEGGAEGERGYTRDDNGEPVAAHCEGERGQRDAPRELTEKDRHCCSCRESWVSVREQARLVDTGDSLPLLVGLPNTRSVEVKHRAEVMSSFGVLHLLERVSSRSG